MGAHDRATNPFAARRGSRAETRSFVWLGFLFVVAAYALVACWRIDLPGVYMDEVNPDYLAVKILNPRHASIVAWVLQGNYVLGDRVPILVQLYHGSQTFWLGLPLFALFGTTVEGLRLAHAVFATAVLAALYAVLLRVSLRPWQATLACAALALDPSFSYAFRTQSYITLAADAWLLLALWCLLPDARGAPSRRRLFWSGFWAGTAVVGYFVHAFFVPALALGLLKVTMRDDPHSRRRKRLAWLGGLAAGASPFVLGYALILRKVDGLAGWWNFIVGQQASLRAFDSPLDLPGRLNYAWTMIVAVVSDAWHHAMMFGQWVEVPGTGVKLALLTLAPLLLLFAATLRRRASLAQALLVALPLSFTATALAFGNRLGGHHFVTLLPLFYAALAVGWSAWSSNAALHIWPLAAWSAPFIVLAALNVAGQLAEGERLAATRGVGLMSDAINRLAADLNAGARKPRLVLPDWGLALPVAFLTRGSVAITDRADPPRARAALCAGSDVAIALVNGDRAKRTDEFTRDLRWHAPEIVRYRQADGAVVFDLVTYRGATDGPGCTSATGDPATAETSAR